MIKELKKMLLFLQKINEQNNKKLLSTIELDFGDAFIVHLKCHKEELQNFIQKYKKVKPSHEAIETFNVQLIKTIEDVSLIRDTVQIAQERNQDYFKNKN